MRENCTYGSMRGRAYPITRGVPLYSTPLSILIDLRGKAANFTQRKTECDGASRGNHAAYPLFLFFVKVLSGTCHETGFRGCAAFLFRVKAAVFGMVGAERR